MRKINGYENYYVDKEGNVYRKLKPSYQRNKKKTYKQIVLSEEGKTKTHAIHRLVAEHYVDNPNGYNTVHHRDENKWNNYYTNLEWIDGKDHRAHHVAMGECRIHNFKECYLYRQDILLGAFKSIAEACRFANKTYGIKYYPLYKHREYKDFKIVEKSVSTIQ